MRKVIVGCIFILVTMLFFENSYGEETGWTTVSIVHPWTNGLHLTVANGNNDPSGCGGNGGYMLLPTGAPEYQLISSVILTAFAAGKQIRVYTSGCTSGGSTIIGVMVQ